jgi:hypothetical protein
VTVKIDSSRTAAVDPDYYWRPMVTCPLGAKVQLMNPSGVAVYGTYSGKDTQWRGWAPCPKQPQWMKDGLAGPQET